MDRLTLHAKLLTLSSNVYFQPPASIDLKYPAIIYKLEDIDTKHASNEPYLQVSKFTVTILDKDPESQLLQSMSKWKSVRFIRSYISDNLNHFVFSIY